MNSKSTGNKHHKVTENHYVKDFFDTLKSLNSTIRTTAGEAVSYDSARSHLFNLNSNLLKNLRQSHEAFST